MTDTPAIPRAATYPGRRQKVPPFARYKGTSAWRRDRRRAREYDRFRAAARHDQAAAAPSP